MAKKSAPFHRGLVNPFNDDAYEQIYHLSSLQLSIAICLSGNVQFDDNIVGGEKLKDAYRKSAHGGGVREG